jgi:hypothetical protein
VERVQQLLRDPAQLDKYDDSLRHKSKH